MERAGKGTVDIEHRSYESAVSALLSPVHQATTPTAIRTAAARRRSTLDDMQVYLKRLGLELTANNGDADNRDDIHVPSLIFHIAGTKGKGSTSSFCESILRNAHGLNTGMFTSPHLVSLRERIRINGVPVSKRVFGEVYWRVRGKLEQHQCDSHAENGVGDGCTLSPLPILPGYFRMLCLMAIYTFYHYQNPRIDAILLEVGVGGRYDATNIYDPSLLSSNQVLVRGVTLIDYDHTRVLGNTLEQIAWEKGGIFISEKLVNIGPNDGGYLAFLEGHDTSEYQQPNNQHDTETNEPNVFASGKNTAGVLEVLNCIANDHGCQLKIVRDSHLDGFPRIGVQGDHQRNNAALALLMCKYAIEKSKLSRQSDASEESFQDALATTFWPGRCHTVSLPCTQTNGFDVTMNLHCDGAHTPISINACIDWFRKVVDVKSSTSAAPYNNVHKVLIFNCGHERNPLPLLFSLFHSNLFHSVYFCRADFERPSSVPKRLEAEWSKESLSNEQFCDGTTVTLESICAELFKSGKVIHSDPTELSASSWQQTLANVWRIFDMYQMNYDGHTLLESGMETYAGLTVKDALAAIQEEAASSAEKDGDDAAKVSLEVCVTGSLYIVGSALEAVEWEEGEASGKILE